MIGQFDFSQKGWVSGKGRTAVWRELGFDGSVENPETKKWEPKYHQKMIEPQYLMGIDPFNSFCQHIHHPKLCFMDVTSATNTRTFIGMIKPLFPSNHKSPILLSKGMEAVNILSILMIINSFIFDFNLRVKLGGTSVTWSYLQEIPVIDFPINSKLIDFIKKISFCSSSRIHFIAMKDSIFGHSTDRSSFRSLWAVTPHERLRLRCILDAAAAELYGLSFEDFAYILRDCDYPKEWLSAKGNSAGLDAKGFWRVDKDKEPHFRHTVLSLIAFHDLKQKGLDMFLLQNEGEGWMLPETLRLADYGLGYDDKAESQQPVASALGERFYDWQLAQDPKESWEECRMHSENIRRILKLSEENVTAVPKKASTQGILGF